MAKTNALSNGVSEQIADIVEQVKMGMVKIAHGPSGSGAGCIIHPEGLILTNSHVVRSDKVQVILSDGRMYQGKLLARDRSIDLAAILLEEQHLPVIAMGDSNSARPGELVFSLGYPWGMDGGLTYGIVIQVGRWPMESPRSKLDLMSASLHLRPGHSGGPMFNARGEIIGLNTMMQGLDVGVAVPINQAKTFLKEVLAV